MKLDDGLFYVNSFEPYVSRSPFSFSRGHDLFQIYLHDGDRDDFLPQHCRLVIAREVQFEHLSFGRGEEDEWDTGRICIWVGLLTLIYLNLLRHNGLW